LLDGGLYHVYNRTSRGEHIFADSGEAERFVTLLREVKVRDDWTVYGWCLMSNHFHLAVRTGEVPLSRSLHFLQGTFARSFNRRHDLRGPLWQGRFQARLVQVERYLARLVAYIHLNPVRAGVVDGPEDYELSGHRELLGKAGDPVVDVDVVLARFGAGADSARREYEQVMKSARGEGWDGEDHDPPPWWRRGAGMRLAPPEATIHVDALGRSTGLERPELGAADFLARACEVLGIAVDRLASRRRDPETVSGRVLVATLGVERYRLRAKEIAIVLRKHPDWVSRWVRLGSDRRAEDPAFRARLDLLDREIARVESPGAGVDDRAGEDVEAGEATPVPGEWASWL
jgi:REP element-mobilizing transposase RayT